MKNSDIRLAVIDALEAEICDAALYFDGRPAIFEETDFPAIAVYLTDAAPTGEEVDVELWQAVLHIEVFLPAQAPDSELDEWVGTRIFPALNDIQALRKLLTLINIQGYDYQRDDDLALWGSADLKYTITYEM